MRRVVITGVGIVSPLGKNIKENWDNLVNLKSGIKSITKFDLTNFPEDLSRIAGEVDENPETGFNAEQFIEKKDLKKVDKFICYGLGATAEAIEDAGLTTLTDEEKENIGVLVSSGIGGLINIQNTSYAVKDRGAKKISPFFIPSCLINLISGHIAIKYGFKGANFAIVSACASGTHAIGEGAEIIKRGDANIMVVGGAESCICEIGIGGFCAMKALSTNYNDNPTRASRPWDKDRDGFVMGEGAGILILEEYEHAKKRGAKIYGELAGYSATCDAYHITAPDSEGRGAKLAIRKALEKANILPEQIDYINAHGTSTPAGDVLEFGAVKEVFKNTLNTISMSSTKSSTGHLLGAAGAIEAIYCLKAMENSVMPATLNLDNVDENCQGIDLVANQVKEKTLNYTLSNSFGFGGTNACVVLKKI